MFSQIKYRSPLCAVDVIVEDEQGRVVLIKRETPPIGWALPGGYVEYGESLWEAAQREARDKTGYPVKLTEQFYTYSDPKRDSRCHSITTVFVASVSGPQSERAADLEVKAVDLASLPPLVFDHEAILKDFELYRTSKKRPGPKRHLPAPDARKYSDE